MFCKINYAEILIVTLTVVLSILLLKFYPDPSSDHDFSLSLSLSVCVYRTTCWQWRCMKVCWRSCQVQETSCCQSWADSTSLWVTSPLPSLSSPSPPPPPPPPVRRGKRKRRQRGRGWSGITSTSEYRK